MYPQNRDSVLLQIPGDPPALCSDATPMDLVVGNGRYHLVATKDRERADFRLHSDGHMVATGTQLIKWRLVTTQSSPREIGKTLGGRNIAVLCSSVSGAAVDIMLHRSMKVAEVSQPVCPDSSLDQLSRVQPQSAVLPLSDFRCTIFLKMVNGFPVTTGCDDQDVASRRSKSRSMTVSDLQTSGPQTVSC